MRFNPPPGWPTPPSGWSPPEDWKPDASWPTPPPGWDLWVDDSPTHARAARPAGWLARHWWAPTAGAFLLGLMMASIGQQPSSVQGVASMPTAAPVTISVTPPPVKVSVTPPTEIVTVTPPPATITVTTTVEPATQPAGFASVPAASSETDQTDPRFSTCREAKANGYGNYRRGVDPEYDWYRDADNDGKVCE